MVRLLKRPLENRSALRKNLFLSDLDGDHRFSAVYMNCLRGGGGSVSVT